MTRRPVMRWLKLILVNPVTTVALLLLLLFDAWSLPWANHRGGKSTVGLFLHSRRTNAARIGSFHVSIQAFRVSRSGTEFAITEENGWSAYAPEPPPDVALLLYTSDQLSRGAGFWAITRGGREWHLSKSGGAAFTQDDWAAARALADNRLVQTSSEVARTPVYSGPDSVVESKILWSGYLHNTLTLLCLTLLLNSLRWVSHIPEYIRARRRAARGQCPQCGYPLAGLTTPTCPECGNPLSPAASP